jgi:hypothetical protein
VEKLKKASPILSEAVQGGKLEVAGGIGCEGINPGFLAQVIEPEFLVNAT